MFVGGIRAVLLQTLHPAAMTAVAEHSGYRGDMWGRLARTSRFIAVTTFGTAGHAPQAVDAVRAIHTRVSGTLDDGTPYAASDPHLLLWVHVAEIDSFLRTHQTYGRLPLDQAGRDSTSPRPRRSPTGSGSSTRRPPRSSSPPCSRRSGPSFASPPRPGGRATPAVAPRPAVRRPAGVRRAGGRGHRLDARLGAT